MHLYITHEHNLISLTSSLKHSFHSFAKFLVFKRNILTKVMTLNHLYSLLTMEKGSLAEYKHSSSTSSSPYPLFGLLDFFLIGFFRWVSFAHIFLSRFWPILQHKQCVSEKKSKDVELQTSIKHDDGLFREDAEMVMRRLGLSTDPESEGLLKRYSSEELSNLFEEKEPSLEEVKHAFDVFDENRDGFLDPIDLQRVLTILGLKQGANLENCRRMIRSFDGNKDGRIDFYGFVKFMENNFC